MGRATGRKLGTASGQKNEYLGSIPVEFLMLTRDKIRSGRMEWLATPLT